MCLSSNLLTTQQIITITALISLNLLSQLSSNPLIAFSGILAHSSTLPVLTYLYTSQDCNRTFPVFCPFGDINTIIRQCENLSSYVCLKLADFFFPLLFSCEIPQHFSIRVGSCCNCYQSAVIIKHLS